MLNPRRTWTKFKSLDEKIDILRKLQIISPKTEEIKKFCYKGYYTNYSPVECDVIGYVDDNEIILNVNNELHSILPDYFIDMQKRERFIIIDIETPMSFSPSSGIKEVAAIFVEDYQVVDSLHLKKVVDENITDYSYGKGLAAIEENFEFKEQFKSFIKKYKCPLIAHNASFDRNFLKYWGWIDDKTKFYCSMNNIKSNYKLDSYKLSYLLEYFNIKTSQSHEAMKDVLDLLEILKITKIDKWTLLGTYKKQNETKKISPQPNSPQSSYYISKEQKEQNKNKLLLAKENIISNIFNNKRIVFTGDMTKERIDMMEIAIKYGAIVTTSISGKTDLLVVGLNPGKSKLLKAKDLNLVIISEDKFWDIINSKTYPY
ncbi:BRCT domain-containing protein [Clostridium perfringens]|uniref:BRCT domain-containing protein n=1 Tax=Clostridium perfringens TaxID=1502 RepID=UPI0024BBF990|nr:BRCT domain-containing protein [Clostridium perfringens]